MPLLQWRLNLGPRVEPEEPPKNIGYLVATTKRRGTVTVITTPIAEITIDAQPQTTIGIRARIDNE